KNGNNDSHLYKYAENAEITSSCRPVSTKGRIRVGLGQEISMRNKTTLMFILVLASAFSLGCGVKKATHQKVLSELTATQAELDATRGERDALLGDRDSLQADKANLSSAEAEASARAAKLAAE